MVSVSLRKSDRPQRKWAVIDLMGEVPVSPVEGTARAVCSLAVTQGSRVTVWQLADGFVAGDSEGGGVQLETLSGCIARLLSDVPGLQLSRSAFLTIDVPPGCEDLIPEVLTGVREGSPGLKVTESFDDVRWSVAAVNGQDYVSVAFDDGTYELERRLNDDLDGFFSPIGQINETELESRTSGLSRKSVGRLGDGHVVMVDQLDSEGSVLATRQPMSNAEAVHVWLDDISDEFLDYLGMVAHVFRDGEPIQVASDFDPWASDSLEVKIEIRLTDSEFQDLWARYSTPVRRVKYGLAPAALAYARLRIERARTPQQCEGIIARATVEDLRGGGIGWDGYWKEPSPSCRSIGKGDVYVHQRFDDAGEVRVLRCCVDCAVANRVVVRAEGEVPE